MDKTFRALPAPAEKDKRKTCRVSSPSGRAGLSLTLIDTVDMDRQMEGLPGLILILMMMGATQRAQRNTGQNKVERDADGTGRDGTGRGGAERGPVRCLLTTTYYT